MKPDLSHDSGELPKPITGLPVAGYRDQSPTAVAMVNANKEIEERMLRILDDLAALPDVDKRWLATGRTHIEIGFMAVNRSIFRPARASMDEKPIDATARIAERG